MKPIDPQYAPDFIVVDLFCGFGGTTKGYTMATRNGKAIAVVAACVNHDPKAIESHWKNHPDVEHFEEDITKLYGRVINGRLHPSYQLVRLIRLVNIYRAFYPNAKVVLWASLECTNFSKAKGGMSRDADSRTLAHHLDRYVQALQPDYIKIENVVEFMAWGPLKIKTVKDENGYESSAIRVVKVKKVIEPDPIEELLFELEQASRKKPMKKKPKKKTVTETFIAPHWIPESTKNGQYWLQWREHIRSLGYKDDWKQLNSADFGAYTSRNRLFGIFARPDLPIAWPEPTHAKEPSKTNKTKCNKAPTLFDNQPEGQSLKKWKPVRDVLNFAQEGKSILTRKKPLKPNSLERIYAGLVKFVAQGDTSFLTKYYSGLHGDKNISVHAPAGTITTVDHHAMVQAAFLSKYYSGDPASKNTSIDEPAATLRTKDGQALIQTDFLVKYNSRSQKGKYIPPSLEEPCPVISTQGRLALAQPEFLVQRHDGDPKAKIVSLDSPARTLTSTGGNQDLVQPVFLTHYYSSGGLISSVNDPCPTITRRDGKAIIHSEHFLECQFGQSQCQSINVPAGTVMPNDKHRLISTEPFLMPTNYDNQPKSLDEPAPPILASRRHHYLVNPAWGGHPKSIDQPCCVIVARGDKVPLYLVQIEQGSVAVAVYEDDSPIMIKIKQFMAAFGLVDIKMRMLHVKELLRIQGFPANYTMVGTQSDKKKFIGNSVVPLVPKAWSEVLSDRLAEWRMAA